LPDAAPALAAKLATIEVATQSGTDAADPQDGAPGVAGAENDGLVFVVFVPQLKVFPSPFEDVHPAPDPEGT
jgi:hypothetical protein